MNEAYVFLAGVLSTLALQLLFDLPLRHKHESSKDVS